LSSLNGLVLVDGVLATVFSGSGWTITSGPATCAPLLATA
jgi:hypothetical protein